MNKTYPSFQGVFNINSDNEKNTTNYSKSYNWIKSKTLESHQKKKKKSERQNLSWGDQKYFWWREKLVQDSIG